MVRGFIICIFSLLIYAPSYGQDSMIPDVSYAYLERLISIAKENYPTVKSMESRKLIAELNVKKAQYAWFDAFSFSYLYQPKSTIDITKPSFFNGYQIGLTLNLGSLIQKPFLIKQARQEFNIASNDSQEYDISLTTEVKQKYFTYIQALTNLKVQTKSVEDAAGIYKTLQYKFEKGEESFVNYSQASLNLNTLRQSKVTLEGSFLIAKAALEAILGEKLENIN